MAPHRRLLVSARRDPHRCLLSDRPRPGRPVATRSRRAALPGKGITQTNNWMPPRTEGVACLAHFAACITFATWLIGNIGSFCELGVSRCGQAMAGLIRTTAAHAENHQIKTTN